MGFAYFRRRAGLTQIKAAKALNVDQSTIALWESGKTKPRAALLCKIAALYGCTIGELLSNTADTTTHDQTEEG